MTESHLPTQEEIDALVAESYASICPAVAVSGYPPRGHDWRLWARQETHRHIGPSAADFVVEFWETWYCTRCRKIEERTGGI
jgi:hypothetical protein